MYAICTTVDQSELMELYKMRIIAMMVYNNSVEVSLNGLYLRIYNRPIKFANSILRTTSFFKKQYGFINPITQQQQRPSNVHGFVRGLL